jgi:hypothetical protein
LIEDVCLCLYVIVMCVESSRGSMREAVRRAVKSV